jgi:hypothetical protein
MGSTSDPYRSVKVLEEARARWVPTSDPRARGSIAFRTWKGRPVSKRLEVRDLHTGAGAVEDCELSGNQEIWRVRLGRSVFTAYATGTL